MRDNNCPLCGAADVAPVGNAMLVECAACQTWVFQPNGGPLVLVGLESVALSHQVGLVLVSRGFNPVRTGDGKKTFELILAKRPPAVVLDVGLVNPTAFQIIDHTRALAPTRATKVILLASVFNKTAYKRRPSSLYGADDYIEQHHIGDMLPDKLGALLGFAAKPLAGEVSVGPDAAADVAAQLSGAERVWALAKRIVADIALYHQDDIVGASSAPSERLSAALEEGRQLLAEKVTPSDYPNVDPIGEAYRALVETLAVS